MNDSLKKYLICGGVLLGIGVVSSAALAGVNLVTSPLISAANQEKANKAYKEIFDNATFGDKNDFSSDADKKALNDANLTLSTVDYYVTAYSDEAKTTEIGKVFHGKTQGRDAEIELLVGFTSENGKTAFKKISIISCSDSFKTTFEKNYLDPVNNGTKNYDDLKSIGATITATAVSKIVGEANKLYAALSGGIVEDPATWNQAAFSGKNYTVSTSSTAVESSSYAEFSKFYSYYDDELGHNEIGRWYVGTSGDFTAAIAIDESGYEGGYVLASSYTDIDYKANPFLAKDYATSGDTLAALKSLAAKAEALVKDDPFDTISHQAVSLFANGDHASKSVLNQAITGIDYIAEDKAAWPSATKRQIIANSYTVYDASDAELGVVYEAEFHISMEEESGGVEIEAHGGLYFLLGFSGDNYDNPTLTNVLELEDSFSRATAFRNKFLDVWNASSEHSWEDFKAACAAATKIGSAKIGATVSTHSLYSVANLERVNYASLKGGK